jgi:hypothetical protein
VIVDILLQPVGAVVGVIATVFSAIGRLADAVLKPFISLGDVWNNLTAGIQGAGEESVQFGNLIRSIANIALFPLRMIFGGIGLAISGVGLAIETVINGFTLLTQVILFPVTAIGILINGIGSIGTAITSTLINPIGAVTGLISGFIGLLSTIPSVLLAPFNGISSIINSIGAAIGAVGESLAGIPFLGGVFSAVTGIQAPPKTDESQTQYFAEGGRVYGSGIGDTVDARLTPGEFVVTPGPAAAAMPLLESLNAGGMPGLLAALPTAMPQIVTAPIAVPVQSEASGTGGFGAVTVNLNVDSIVVGNNGSSSNSQAMALEILDQLSPHLRRAVSDILRDLVEKTR